MKVLLINGSTRLNGCTYIALSQVEKVLREEGIETELLQMGGKPIRDCIACGKCSEKGRCVFNDDLVNEWIDKAENADGFVFGSPVYYAHPSGQFLSLLDRMFYAGSASFQYKPGAAVVSARRGGTTASFDVLNKYFTITNMPVIGSTYWNMVHGTEPEQVGEDLEGLQTMRNVGRNMAWILKCIELGKTKGIGHPEAERGNRTNFVR
ncbi:MAG: flavodoxin family protein [Eubacteriales bacterium]|nr:flavodoxin family protein [Eubacteriales bacterium]